MITWKYIIKGNYTTMITKNHDFAEQKSKLGCIVYCKREKNIFKGRHYYK
jgi:hypothetical protein